MSECTALSPKENTVLDYIMRGFSYKDIAKELEISHRTIEQHAHRIMLKRHAPTRSLLMAVIFYEREKALLGEIASLRSSLANVTTE